MQQSADRLSIRQQRSPPPVPLRMGSGLHRAGRCFRARQRWKTGKQRNDTNTTTTKTPPLPGVRHGPMSDNVAAFGPAERKSLGLTRRLPWAVVALEQQAQRACQQTASKEALAPAAQTATGIPARQATHHSRAEVRAAACWPSRA
jgi:hypothetical protein